MGSSLVVFVVVVNVNGLSVVVNVNGDIAGIGFDDDDMV